MTECATQRTFDLQLKVPVVVTFDAPEISSDGGLVLLAKLDDRLGLSAAVAGCLQDRRDPERVEHTYEEQIRQRVLMIAMGYEDCNDAATMRNDPVLKTLCATEPKASRALSSQPTLSRLENSVRGKSVRGIRRYLESSYVRDLPPDTTLVVLDIDTTCDPTHGQQQLTFFNAHYDTHMYHPFLVFDGQTGQLVSAMLQPGNAGAARCAPGIVVGIIQQIKQRFPAAQIVVRGDAGFSTPLFLQRLEQLDLKLAEVYYLLGFAKNRKLEQLVAAHMSMARECFGSRHETIRQFTVVDYKCGSWKHSRLIIAKAEHGPLGANPRFVITNLHGFPARLLYQAYCERGQCENYIKDFKNALCADRLSCSKFLPNFFRLLLHAMAYRIMHALRAQMLAVAPEQPPKQFDTIRLRLLKVGAQVTQSARRILIHLSKSFPLAKMFAAVADRILSLMPVGLRAQ